MISSKEFTKLALESRNVLQEGVVEGLLHNMDVTIKDSLLNLEPKLKYEVIMQIPEMDFPLHPRMMEDLMYDRLSGLGWKYSLQILKSEIIFTVKL